ncbi:hypothetical protein Ancab_011958 [Ancistrocladus abbreviatus]
METQDCNSSDIRPEAEVGSANASNNFSLDLIEDFNDVPSNEDDFDQSTIDPSARPSKKIRSKVWDHLIKIRAENLKDQKVQCKYCNAILGADPAKGTSFLKNHIDRCKKYPANIELAQRKLALQAKFSVDGSKLMMEGEPIAEILKDRPSWFRDCQSLEVYTMFPAGNGGTIELVYTQTMLAPARDFWTLRYTITLDNGSFVFELISSSSPSNGKPSAMNSFKSMRETGESINQILYVLDVSGEQLQGENLCMYELSFAGNEELNDTVHGLKFLLENVVLGDPVSFHTDKESVFSHNSGSTLSSLSWMGTAASDIIDSRYFFIEMYVNFFSCCRVFWLMSLVSVYTSGVVDPVTDEMLAKFVVDSHFKSQLKGANIEDKSISISQEDPEQYSLHADPEIIPQDLLKKYITYAKLNVFPRLHDADMDKLAHVYAELRRESSSFRKYMTFKKDYNELLMYLLNGLVKDALHFEKIVSGSTSGLTRIDVKIKELQHKAQGYDIYDLKPFLSSNQFSKANLELAEERGVIRHRFAR